ncbi:histidine kinase [Acinetobacter sp. B5B]|uniref:ATP-binding protein n=1 Tax=Acinetobacter baretiae TaxID=2605383 RepID=UPI0018C277DE|nr:ATP-binding protein [Acinetobacter baretiae]MBF7681750.1 histidine kinase [Acinetobacter baretiae]MBF7685359.1 histidine kinase [Acinetobacter baretiae]
MATRAPVKDPHHLRLWYGIYRIIIAGGLFFSLSIPIYQALHTFRNIDVLYIFTLLIYLLMTIGQFIVVLCYHKTVKYTAVFFASIDLIAFNLMSLVLGGQNINIGLLFAITLFISNFVLQRKMAFLITLLSMSSVIYSPLILNWINGGNKGETLSNNLILAFVFFTIYILAQYLGKYFYFLEKVNLNQKIELNQLHELNQYLLEQIDMGYIILNAHDQVVLINPAAYQLLHYTAHGTATQHLSILQPMLYQKMKQQHLKNGDRFIFELTTPKKHIHIQIQQLHVKEQQLTLLIMQDGQRLQQHAQQLKLASLGKLSASIAHEIRNPLATIVQANELMLDANTEQQHVMHNMIKKQSNRINRIIQSTLDLAHAPSQQPTQIDLKTTIDTLFTEDLFDVNTQISYVQNQPIQLLFDEIHLKQILINLIRNALRYNIHTEKPVQLHAYQQHKKIMIDIIDFGQGVPEEHVKNLFNPFFTTEKQGTGLGLYLSQSLCEANQAQLSYLRQHNATYFRIECTAL